MTSFPDPEQMVADLLSGIDGIQVAYPGTRTLTTIQAGKLPAVRATKTGGSRDQITDRPVVSVAVFAGDANTAKTLAESCCDALTTDRGITTAYGLIDEATATQAPELVTSPDVTAIQCATAVYQLSARR